MLNLIKSILNCIKDDLLLSLRNIYLSNHNHSKGSMRLLAAIEEKQGKDAKQNALSAIESCSISFFPDSLVSHLTSQQSTRQPFVSKLSGALMIADISGFTKFSSQMCALGAVGLDSLYNVTNDFMGLFVSVIYDHDGDGQYISAAFVEFLFFFYFVFYFSYLICWRCTDRDISVEVAVS